MKTTDISLIDDLSPEEISQITERIAYLRSTILQMTQSQFADNVNMSQAYLSLLENGKKELTMSAIRQISSSLRVNLDWLIYGIGDDDNVFQSEKITKSYLEASGKSSALAALQKAYTLKPDELDFISRYLDMSSKERLQYSNALKTIAELQH